MLYYIIGYVTFGNILSLFELDCIWKKLFFGMSGIITGIYSVLLFFEIDVLKALEAVVFMEMFVPVIRALLVIWFNFILAYLCRNAVLLAEFGRSTLYLCGSEYLIKTIVPVIADILGLQIVPNGPLAIYIYCLFLIYFVYKFLAPVEKEIIKKVQNILQLQFYNNVYAKRKSESD